MEGMSREKFKGAAEDKERCGASSKDNLEYQEGGGEQQMRDKSPEEKKKERP